jgi:short-subunit dehydrogenase involved in D-alanine esterification of teichoic acids
MTNARGDGLPFPLAADANAGSVVVVTGGGTGIGRATAGAFARSGARLAICGRTSIVRSRISKMR